jgi:allantoin racemase
MRLLFINPNSTESMTETIASAARHAAPPGVEIIARTNRVGPPAIQGEVDGAAALPGLLAEIAAADEPDAIVIACFDDTGLSEARALAPCPVLGIGQAAYLAAVLLGRRFSVVTTLEVSVPILEANLAAYGLTGACARVRASGVPVLEVERAGDAIAAEAARALAEDGARAIVLGCAGMAGLTERLAVLPVPVIDGVTAATHLAVAAVALSR